MAESPRPTALTISSTMFGRCTWKSSARPRAGCFSHPHPTKAHRVCVCAELRAVPDPAVAGNAEAEANVVFVPARRRWVCISPEITAASGAAGVPPHFLSCLPIRSRHSIKNSLLTRRRGPTHQIQDRPSNRRRR
ncbi:hypothetical protein C8R44DRAFT_859260 [Mycena epipterygia]|nr:hypothetical protein C8R44DRAFT_859260 [Mycena epipterygia]